MVDTVISGEGRSGLPPFRVVLIDGGIRPQFECTLELLVTTRGNNHLCSCIFGDLQAENGNPSGAKEKNRFAGNQLTPV